MVLVTHGHSGRVQQLPGPKDFQRVIEMLQLAPAGPVRVRGQIAGSLFGFRRLVGRFEVEIAPGH